MITSEDEHGKPLPADKHTKDEIEATFFVPWHQVKTMMHYPDREGFDFPKDLFKNKIGFKQGGDNDDGNH